MRGLGLAMRRFLVFAVVVLVGAGLLGGSGGERAAAQSPTASSLFVGWNLLVYQGIPLSPEQALNDALPAAESVWHFQASTQSWTVWGKALPPSLQSLPLLLPGAIYFVRAASETIWTHPLEPPAPPAPEPEPEPEGTGAWTLTFERTTALFEFAESLTLEESGVMTVSREGAERTLSLDAGSLATVDALLEGNDFYAQWPADTTSGCVSCFVYAITVTSPAGTLVALESDGVGASGDLLQLINTLTAILLAN